MGLDVKLSIADTLKRSVKLMKEVSRTCYMRMHPDSLVFGVKKNIRHGPCRLVLRVFEEYSLTHPAFQNATVRIDLDQLDGILNRYDSYDPVRFFIRNYNTNIIRFAVRHPDGKETIHSLGAPPIHDLPPYMGQQLAGLRPFKITMQADLFLKPLVHSVIHRVPMSIIAMGTAVRIFVKDEVYNYSNFASIPRRSYVRFHLELYKTNYIRKACEDLFNPYICFHTEDPAVNFNVPPAISFPMECDTEHLVFYLPINSIVKPQVSVYNP